MMRRRLLWSVLITIPLLGLGCFESGPKKKSAPIDVVRGKWRAESSPTQWAEVLFTDDEVEMTAETEGSKPIITAAKFSFAKDNPERHMDWSDVTIGETEMPECRCLYKVTGDQMLLIIGGRGDRPKDFYSGTGGGMKTYILTRAKSESDSD